jgi:glycosyltransferase involved in cell wall biosynthesis
MMYQVLRQRADHVIAVSEGYERELIRHGLRRERCTLARVGVDVGAFDAVPSLSDDSARSVGTIGRLIAQKGVDVLVAAAAQVARVAPNVRFLIVGDGPLRDDCIRWIESHGLRHRVTLLGERTDVPALLSQMSVFVSASRWEGMPAAVLEALAARRPVVATRVLGSSELIEDGVTGLLVPPDDPAAMSAAILRLLNDSALARSLGKAGRQVVESRYSLKVMAEQVMDVYRQVVTRHVDRT